jgi:Predicted AAA-ATPase/PD-(D/E)XK nuclease superfamily
MAKKKLSIGAQSFVQIDRDNMIYVDKTEKIHEVMQLGVHNFIVRPRRFGKSLFLDTVAAIYEGKKEAFEGTWAYDHVDWEAEKRPVLRIDFTQIEYHECPLEQGLKEYLLEIVNRHGLTPVSTTSKGLFRELIHTLAREKPIAILIDEYEMPLTDYIGEDQERLEDNIHTLKKFYGTMKGAGQYIHRSYITGVSKIGKIGVFSDLNMLNDLSLDPRFTTLFGFTETELRHYYADYISEAAQNYQRTENEILAEIKAHYNGYSWDGIEENKVYNPFSIVNFFQSFQFRNYWFETGTPTLLVRGARQQYISLKDLENLSTNADLLQSANLKDFYGVGLLFQTGYLTIKKIEVKGWEREYTLGLPNREVQASFAKHLLAEYVEKPVDYTDFTLSHRLRSHLENEELKAAFQVFVPVIASTGYDVIKHTEGYFHTIMHVLMYSTGLTTFSELQNAEGRLDTICLGYKSIYIFEFKLNGSAAGALQQIKAKNYAIPFLNENKTLYLVGVNFLAAEKKIDEILVEQWNGREFVRLEGDFTPLEEGEST